jgi:TRAP-type transport system periplasmic protein
MPPSRRPAKKPADLKGLRICVPENPVCRDMLGALGATPTPVPTPEVFTAQQSGIVEGREQPYPQILSQRSTRCRSTLCTRPTSPTGSIIFNERLYPQQSKEQQKALVESAQEAMDWFLEFLIAQEGKMLEQLKGHGMTVVESDQAAFRHAMKPLYEKYDGIWPRDLRDKIQGFK